MFKRLLIIAGLLLFSVCAAAAQAPSAEAMTAARKLVTTLKLSDQYKALLPAILLGIKPALTQDRPEIEQDYDRLMPISRMPFTPYYNSMLDAAATVYASNFYDGRVARDRGVLSQPGRTKIIWKNRRPSPSRSCRSARMAAARRPTISKCA